jgi:NADH-quinone oxidoreductase subunit J
VTELVAFAAARATVPDVVTFVISAALVLAGAAGVVLSRNPVHAALSLVMTLLGIAVLFVEEDANFIAAVQVIVYAGAIVVLFLFVIMFLGVDREESLRDPLPAQRPLALVLVVVAIGGVVALAATAHWTTGAHRVVGPISTPHRSEVAQLGVELFTKYLYAFEATAGLLVIAVVGAVVLARRPSGPLDDDGDQTADVELGGDPQLGADRRGVASGGEPGAVPDDGFGAAADGGPGGAPDDASGVTPGNVPEEVPT